VLFSEPKIPQYSHMARKRLNPIEFQCSSASRKFLNLRKWCARYWIFKSFSALQRAENSSMGYPTAARGYASRFSALQRAENSSIGRVEVRGVPVRRFQCSSASRKFLNIQQLLLQIIAALFQCSSASRKFLNRTGGKGGV